MPRLKIELPASFPFKTELAVRISDINYGGHLGNDAVLSLFQEARLQFLATKGMSELDAGGPGLTMVSAGVAYKGEGFRGDVLEIEVAVTEIGPLGFELAYKATRKSDSKEIARAFTSMAFFDYSKRKLAKTPQLFIDSFQAFPVAG